MPEIKNNFSQGKINTDLDERLIPKGQYRYAMNIQVSTSEGADVGTAQNILGNARIEDIIGTNFTCIGAISDEKNDRFFWFITSDSLDAIYEYKTDGSVTPVIIDANMDLLKFQNNIITGINIIDDILLWTDNFNEPRKINVERCKLGVDGTNPNTTHTKLVVNGVVTSEDIVEENITVIKKRPSIAPQIKANKFASLVPTLATCALSQNNEGDFLVIAGDTIEIRVPRIGIVFIPGFDAVIGDILLLSQSLIPGVLPSNAELSGTVTSVVETIGTPGYHTFTLEVTSILNSLPTTITTFNGNNIDAGLLMSVVVQSDLSGSIFSEKFIRFGTRWKYEDGEYSAFSPFTDVVFNAGTFSFHPTKDTFNLGMQNNCESIDLTKLISPDIPADVIQVDILFKLENSTTIYSIDRIKPNDPIDTGQSSNNWNTITGNTSIFNGTTLASTDLSGSYSGKYTITTENIYAALPSNQLLRPWDNVPKKALAQEVTGNRVVYANYTQGHNMLNGSNIAKPFIDVDYRQRSLIGNENLNFNEARQSLKTFKNYQVGVVYGDEYGRETPVFTSQNASLKIPWDADSSNIFNGNASRSTQLTARLRGDQPDFASYYKFFVKQISGEYYNLTMDRIYRAEDTENLWISFPSSDVNKVQEGEYIILKKQVDLNVQVEPNNKYKVIDIKNEAPDFIKFDSQVVGNVGGEISLVQALFVGYATGINIPAEDNNQIEIKKSIWVANGGSNLEKIEEKLQLTFVKTLGNSLLESQTYKISVLSETNSNTNYKITLNKTISDSDSWVLSDELNFTIDPTLRVRITKVTPKDGNEFQGRFFVKIIADLTAKQYLESLIDEQITYRSLIGFDTYYLADEQAANGTDGSLGVVNATNQFRYNASSDPQSLTNEAKSNTAAAWDKLYEFGLGVTTPSWFIDQAYFASVHPLDTSDPTGETGLLGVGDSGRHHVGSGGAGGAYFVDSIEGIINTINSGNPYTNVGASVNSTTDWGARHWTYQSLGLESPIAFPGNEVDDIYTGGQNYMHVSFGPVGINLHDGIFDVGSFSQQSAPNKTIWQYIDPGSYWNPVILNYPNIPSYSSSTSNFFDMIRPWYGTGVYSDPTNLNSGLYHNRHLEQWKIQDADIAAIAYKFRTPGAQFRFDGFEEVFTITNFRVKRLYNHTPFRTTQKEWDGSTEIEREPKSVEHFFLAWLNSITSNFNSPSSSTERNDLMDVLERFGAPNNRRLLYILELDKNPNDYLQTSDFVLDVDTLQNLRFVEPTIITGDASPTISPAIWETELKDETDLNIYYEASNAIPLKINTEKENSEMFAPIGSRVWCSKSNSMPVYAGNTSFVITNWEFGGTTYNNVEFASPGLNVIGSADLATQSTVYNGKNLRFFKPDGSFVTAKIFAVKEIIGNFVTKVSLFNTLSNKTNGLSYYDCFSFGNGVESNRIRDDFNAMTINKGVKASAVLEQEYKEENRKSGLIYSGIYNSTSGVNNLNQFIAAEKITKDLNPTFGSIQKLFQRRIDLISFCEDKVVKILSNKDALYNADGNSQLVATNRVLGDANPFSGDFGISKNPESFASESYRSYFTDKQRGAVLRLSMDGLTPISEAGMSDYFKDNLKNADRIIGSHDDYKGNYNLTLSSDNATVSVGKSQGPGGTTTVPGVTISYNEKVKGWTSFKSFIPEFGLSCVNSYYTFDDGQPYKHHITESPIDQSPVNRNTFYQDALVPSTITSVINDQPSLIKSFNTINYEGNEGWVNAVVTTDQQNGTVAEFIEKEGKFFNYIRGGAGDVDLQAFNFQGIGQTTGIEYSI